MMSRGLGKMGVILSVVYFCGCIEERESRPGQDALGVVSSPRSQPSIQPYVLAQKQAEAVFTQCQVTTLDQCSEWRALYEQVTADLREVTVNAPQTLLKTQVWLGISETCLRSDLLKMRQLGGELLKIILRRLRDRELPKEAHLRATLEELTFQEKDPLHQTDLLTLLHWLTPLGEGQGLIEYTHKDRPVEVQERAWRLMAERHSEAEPLMLNPLRSSYRSATNLSLKSGMIRAASSINAPIVIRWCGQEWWQTQLFEDCKLALSRQYDERATRSLLKWVDTVYEESEQSLKSDELLADALDHLSRAKLSSRARRRYLNYLDRYFYRRRSEQSSIQVIESWRNLSSPRFALELCLRYYRPKDPKVVAQAHLFERHLKQLIHELSDQALLPEE